MSQLQKKGWFSSLSPMTRTILGISIIALFVVLGVAYGPHYNDTNTTTGEGLPQPVTIDGEVSSLTLNRSLVYKGVTLTITNVDLAHSFSDDGKSSYAHVPYIIRVNLHVQSSTGQAGPVGIDFANLAHLLLADGTRMPCKLAQISPDVLPGQNKDGFLDFWVKTPYTLNTLSLLLDTETLAFR